MSGVHHQFFLKLSCDTITFNRPHISLRDLKRQIMVGVKLKAISCDLWIANAWTTE
ncbi:PREDICTED: E3 ubiquitin-protein ligase RBBP6-like, partial [Tauraco erythrolophus]|uniref:E3 ubiquitin-protein ligase RBBP6-like n=1 Tax=Tauraco erythrolophus TaxID=121530 RepID=UPI000523BC37